MLLAGCGPTKKQNFQSVLNSYIGNSENILINNFGVPTNTYTKPDGVKVLELTEKRVWDNYDYFCTINYQVKGNKVLGVGWKSTGDFCWANYDGI